MASRRENDEGEHNKSTVRRIKMSSRGLISEKKNTFFSWLRRGYDECAWTQKRIKYYRTLLAGGQRRTIRYSSMAAYFHPSSPYQERKLRFKGRKFFISRIKNACVPGTKTSILS